MKSPQSFYMKWRNQCEDVTDMFEFAEAYYQYRRSENIKEWLKKHAKPPKWVNEKFKDDIEDK